MSWTGKILLGYSVCLVLAIVAAYLDRNDPSGGYVTPSIRVFETLMFSFLLFSIIAAVFGVVKLISIGIKK